MKLLFGFILLIHGLIHMMGFAKAFGLAELPQLTQAISRAAGFAWLVAAVFLMLTAAFVLGGQTIWWMVALPALLLSQSVIILSWQDARWGTLANLLVLLVALVAGADWGFVQMVKHERQEMLSGQAPVSGLVRREQLAALPAVVQKWLLRAGVVGKPLVQTVSLHQRGKMRTKPDGAWLPLEANQVFKLSEPGFSWLARVRMMPLVPLIARDQYVQGQGKMLIKLLALFPVVNARGPSIDQGSMLRFLAEAVWFPSVALAPYLSWQGLDQESARATMTYGGITADATFYFTPEGDFSHLKAQRYYDRPTGATLESWLITADPQGYRSFAGLRIPARSQVTWQLKEGDFNWLEIEITNINYNPESFDIGLSADTKELSLK